MSAEVETFRVEDVDGVRVVIEATGYKEIDRIPPWCARAFVGEGVSRGLLVQYGQTDEEALEKLSAEIRKFNAKAEEAL